MASLSSEKLRSEIVGLLKGSDLQAWTSKKVRKALEESHKVDLTERKSELDGMVLSVLEQLQDEPDKSDAESSASEIAGAESNHVRPRSNSLSSLSSLDDEPPKKKKKAAKGAKAPKQPKAAKAPKAAKGPKQSDIDAEMARRMQEQEGGRGCRRAAVVATVALTKSSRYTRKPDAKPREPRKLYLSPVLAELMGVDMMARSDVVKRMWEIINKEDLKDPKNKSYIICNPELEKVFGRKRLKAFGMMKYLAKYIKDPKEVF